MLSFFYLSYPEIYPSQNYLLRLQTRKLSISTFSSKYLLKTPMLHFQPFFTFLPPYSFKFRKIKKLSESITFLQKILEFNNIKVILKSLQLCKSNCPAWLKLTDKIVFKKCIIKNKSIMLLYEDLTNLFQLYETKTSQKDLQIHEVFLLAMSGLQISDLGDR